MSIMEKERQDFQSTIDALQEGKRNEDCRKNNVCNFNRLI